MDKSKYIIDIFSAFLITSPPMKKHHSITDVPGIKVGHASDFNALTGCTVKRAITKARGFGILPAYQDRVA